MKKNQNLTLVSRIKYNTFLYLWIGYYTSEWWLIRLHQLLEIFHT